MSEPQPGQLPSDSRRGDSPARARWALSIQAERASLEPGGVEALLARWLPAPLQLFRHRWFPHGLSLFGSSAQLTLVLHTWPEHGAASLDLFFSDAFDARQFVAQLTQASGWRVVLAHESPRLVPG